MKVTQIWLTFRRNVRKRKQSRRNRLLNGSSLDQSISRMPLIQQAKPQRRTKAKHGGSHRRLLPLPISALDHEQVHTFIASMEIKALDLPGVVLLRPRRFAD